MDQNPMGLELPTTINVKDTDRGNRLCVCVSDLHFTDGTVGKQSRDDWMEFFDEIESICRERKIEELHFVLAGDIVDFIRTSRWAERGAYPWQRNHPEFRQILRSILRGILELHGTEGPNGFFYRLRNLRQSMLQHGTTTVEIFILLGNHDKEILLDSETLTLFYKECLGMELTDIPLRYRRWVGRQYGQENRFSDFTIPPWFPFYYGDQGFRLFITHGQFRDPDNVHQTIGRNLSVAWNVNQGWDLAAWKALDFLPFREACFGDTVAAGVLSTFIWKIGQALPKNENLHLTELWEVIQELDLYRPSYLGVSRIIAVAAQLRRHSVTIDAAKIIEQTLLDCIESWLNDPYVLISSPAKRKLFLKILKWFTGVSRRNGLNIEIKAIEIAMRFLEYLHARNREKIFKVADFQNYPGFLKAYRHYGFEIYGEGHTHEPLQIDVSIEDQRKVTYINFGTWRDQIVPTVESGFRRRSVGRTLYVYDLRPEKSGESRRFFYSVEDDLTWNDSRIHLS